VREQVVSPHPASVPPRDAQPGKAGEESRRVQTQAVVALAPCSAGLGARLQHERVESLPPQQRCRGEAGRSGPDDHEVALLHGAGPTILAATPTADPPLTKG